MPNEKSKKRIRPARTAVLILLAIGVLFVSSTGFYTDTLWYKQLGFSQVFFTEIGTQAALFGIGFAVMALVIGTNLYITNRLRPIYSRAPGRDPFAAYRPVFEKGRKAFLILIPVVVGLFAGVASSPNWQDALLFLNATPTGQLDPQFQLDAGFYLFTLPFLTASLGYTTAMFGISSFLVLVIHLYNGAISFNGRKATIAKGAQIQIGVNIALFFAALGGDLWLDQYHSMTSPSGLYTGATYSDVNAAIPGLQIMAMIAGVVALLFVLTAFMGLWRLPIIGTSLMIVSGLLLQGVYPWIVQSFQVVPNERTLEAQFIKRNIEATRLAYGIEDVDTIAYNAKTKATAADLRKDADTTANIRILDPSLVSESFRQLEQYRQYYGFGNLLDVDRYQIDGKTQDTVVAVRELNQSGLGSSQSWFNNTLVYTHGYGMVAAFGNQRTADGQPKFLQSGIPSIGLLGKYEPRVYFGEKSPEYSIVGSPAGSSPKELDYPGGKNGAEQTYTTFDGNGGPKLDNLYTRLAYAIKFGSEQLLLSDSINNSSQILYNRDPAARVAAVAPYLTLDSDPYPAVVDGRIQWIIDGYTTSSRYPYSRAENFGGAITDSQGAFDGENINYIRNSVKATVDAYDGSVKLYAWDTTDPILKTWQKVFPNTILPVSKMSAQLISHVRYPADLFKVQRAILGQYHVTDPGSFYSQQDAWMTPGDPTNAAGATQPPYYMTMQAPNQTKPSFSLYSTFIPRSTGESSRNVLTGYLMVDSDAGSKPGVVSPNYGKLRLLQLPSDTIVPGPGQVQNSFSVDPDVSRLLNLLSQGSTKVLNGNLLTLPVGGGLLYVQPVYIQSTGATSFPLLKKVLVAFGDKIAFEDTLDGALTSLFGGSSTGGGTTTPVTPGKTNAALTSALNAAKSAMAEKAAALAAGDWAAYGKAEAKLKAAIDAALAASGN
ncbi:unannotated protein [freshwater metagenome]|uniref:Unannotated protein n=1 Tax=freshwater metagenome TaxID=449393 RepID=A0A6J7KQY0_9ZZZZ